MVLDPRLTHVAPVLFRSQALHVPEKLKVIIRRCDKQSACKRLRKILLVLTAPTPPHPRPAWPHWARSLHTQQVLLSFEALGSMRCVVTAWLCDPLTTQRAGMCLLHQGPLCSEQGVAHNKCLAKIC